jgi:hypothetical protein
MAIKEVVQEGKEVAKTAERFPWGTTIVIAIISNALTFFIKDGEVKDARTERDLYKNIILQKLEQKEEKLIKVETKVDTLAPKVEAAVNTIDTIIFKTYEAVK